MIRAAVPLLLAFVALLVFIYVITDRRRARRDQHLDLILGQLDEAVALIREIQVTAQDSRDIDPSAEIILMKIDAFHRAPMPTRKKDQSQ